MSSKSKKGQKPAAKSRSRTSGEGGHGGQSPAAARPHPQAHDDDEIVHVPKGRSKLQFLFIVGLMVFTLIIFTVGSQLVGSVGSRRGSDRYMTWQHPSQGELAVETVDWYQYKREIDDFYRVAMGGRFDLKDEDVALEIINDALAQEAGITITNDELANAILEGVPGLSAPQISGDYYRQNLEFMGVVSQRYEAVLRRKMRIARLEQMHMTGFALPAPEAMEAKWKELNQERAYEYIELEHESLREEVTALVPPDEELAVWYDEEPSKVAWLSDAYIQPQSRFETIGLLTGGETTAAALLAAYPFEGTPEEVDQAGRDYYNTQRSLRFKRLEPLAEGDEGYDDPEIRLFLPFEEVAAEVAREAEVMRAMRAWLADKKLALSGGEELDLAAAAAELNLDYFDSEVLMLRDEVEALEGWGSPFTSASLLFTPVDSLTNDVIVGPGALVIGRVLEKKDAAPPAFEDVRDRVAERWVEVRLPELAQEQMQALRDGLFVARVEEEPEEPVEGTDEAADEDEEDEQPERIPDHEAVTAETFSAAATVAGLSVARRDWLVANAPVARDPDWKLPAHEFLRGQAALAELLEGEMSELLVDAAAGRSYLVRSEGSRDPEVVDIDPGELELLRAQVGIESYIEFRDRNMTAERYSELYGLRLVGSEDIPEPEL